MIRAGADFSIGVLESTLPGSRRGGRLITVAADSLQRIRPLRHTQNERRILSRPREEMVFQRLPQLADFNPDDGVGLGVELGRPPQSFHAKHVLFHGTLVARQKPGGEVTEQAALIRLAVEQTCALNGGNRLLDLIRGHRAARLTRHKAVSVDGFDYSSEAFTAGGACVNGFCFQALASLTPLYAPIS